MSLEAGKLRNIVKVQKKTGYQTSDGSMSYSWVDVYGKIYADINPVSASEFLASAAEKMKVQAKITIRYKKDINDKMRVVHGDKIYYINGILQDNDSGIEYLTLMCSNNIED